MSTTIPSKTSVSRSILILSGRPWNQHLASRLKVSLGVKVSTIACQDQFTFEAVSAINPEWIFVPSWSYLIPESIWSRWATVIFHMTNLPYGRGGSPLQNLIQKGFQSTSLTALRCNAELDAGDIYLKKPLSLHGTAEEVFLRADAVIEEMIQLIVCNNIVPVPQQGRPTSFSRRSPSQSNLSQCPEGNLAAWYDHIRMLDAEEYPHAFLEALGMRLEFRRVSRRTTGLYADVKIVPLPTHPA